MPLPEDFFHDHVTYRIRVCMTVMQDPTRGIPNGSLVGLCDNCATPIWIDVNQALPELPEGMVATGDVSLCFPCTQWVAAQVDETPEWIGNEPEGGFPNLT